MGNEGYESLGEKRTEHMMARWICGVSLTDRKHRGV